MFQFPRLPPAPYVFGCGQRGIAPAGFSHSEIRGSKGMCPSPRLIAACHVLRRLPMPRHPPCALSIFSSQLRPCRQGVIGLLITHTVVDVDEIHSSAIDLKNQISLTTLCGCQGALRLLGGPGGRTLPTRQVLCADGARMRVCLPRKEVIQPHLPVRLPCYDFTPLTPRTFGDSPHCWLGRRLRVQTTRVV